MVTISSADGCTTATGATTRRNLPGVRSDAMARFVIPQLLAGLSYRIGHDDAVRNARAELDLVDRRLDEADDLIRRVQARADDHHLAPGDHARRAA